MKQKYFVLVGIVCVFLLIGLSVYKFSNNGELFSKPETEFLMMGVGSVSLSTFNMLNVDEDAYMLSEDEAEEFEHFYMPLLEDYISGKIVKEEFEYMFYRYLDDLPDPENNQELKERKIDSLKIMASRLSKNYVQPMITKILFDIVDRPRRITDKERELIIRSGIHPYEVDKYVEQTTHLLASNDEHECNLIETLKKEGVTFVDGRVDIGNSSLSIKKISEDFCLMKASTVIFGMSALVSIVNMEAFLVGDKVITYDKMNPYATLGTVIDVESYIKVLNNKIKMFRQIASEYIGELEEINKHPWYETTRGVTRNWISRVIFRKKSEPSVFDTRMKNIEKLWGNLNNLKRDIKKLGASHDKMEAIGLALQSLLVQHKQTAKHIEQTKNMVVATMVISALVPFVLYFAPSIITGIPGTQGVANMTKIGAQALKSSIVKFSSQLVGRGRILKSTTYLIGLVFATECGFKPLWNATSESIHMQTNFWVNYKSELNIGFKSFLNTAPFVAVIPMGISTLVTLPLSFGLISGGTALTAYGISHTLVGLGFLTTQGIDLTSQVSGSKNSIAQGLEWENLYAKTGNEEYLLKARESYNEGSKSIGEGIVDVVFMYGIGKTFVKTGAEVLKRKSTTSELTNDEKIGKYEGDDYNKRNIKDNKLSTDRIKEKKSNRSNIEEVRRRIDSLCN